MSLARPFPWVAVALATYGLSASLGAATPTAPAAATAANPAAHNFSYPQRREVNGYVVTVNAPQIRSWPNFETFTGLVAIEVAPPGKPARYVTASITGKTTVDLAQRLVHVVEPKVLDVVAKDAIGPEYTDVVRRNVPMSKLDVPLDLFLASLEEKVLSSPPPAGFNTSPPKIVVRDEPTFLIFVNGDPVPSEVPGAGGLQVIVNANWPIFHDAAGDGAYYLLDRDRWLTSKHMNLERTWKAAESLPAGFSKLPAGPEFDAARKAVPLQKSARPVPKLLYVEEPTELIIITGKPDLYAIAGTDGLEWVSNTDSPLFRLGKDWYFLVAGRWFTTQALDHGPWHYVEKLPDAFAKIPASHQRAAVRASVPGTVESRMAALEALLPTKTSASRTGTPPVTITYAGEPKFELIPGTEVARAVNTGYDVLRYLNRYYLCYAGTWYAADLPKGPWLVTASVPAAIYAIPPSSPSYHVTQVKVASSTPTTVVFTYPPAYSSNVYVAYGVPYYGTGWYYPPYVYGPVYYPYAGTYGHGTVYNPATGAYASRSVYYGPYGGASYTQGYNPATGRYGYMETAWDGDEWGSYSQTYNPRTGVGTETSRYYNEDKNTSQMERTVAKDGEAVTTNRSTDWDNGTSTVNRSTTNGGSSEATRSVSNGTVSSQGTATTGSGETYSYSGEQTRSGGTSTATAADGTSATATTQRNDGRSASSIEGSNGGQGASVSGQGAGRTTVGQTESGDVYAGHDGNVYKKSDDGWQSYDNGSWSSVQKPAAASGSTAARGSTTGAASATHDFSQLERDFSSRQRGTQQFEQRSGAGQRGSGGSRRTR
jgi:hypothetical protein